MQIGLKISDLDYLTYGEVHDLMIEAVNDGAQYQQVATQADFDRF